MFCQGKAASSLPKGETRCTYKHTAPKRVKACEDGTIEEFNYAFEDSFFEPTFV